ncbi:beta-lactamase [Phlyctema vagabunda]|uniref:Beta-lactamase n=1 Tax=Phlyctema vagabunda TaxID=108571 RepID=A0ABR4PTP2_9HELO
MFPNQSLLKSAVVAGAALVSSTSAYTCPLLGISLPQSTNPSSSEVIQQIAANLTTSLEQDAIANWSYSIRVESLYNDDQTVPLFDYHHTAAEALLAPGSAQNITADSIYRLGSVSKIFPVYALHVYMNDGNAAGISWDDPITKFIPELAEVVASQQENGFDEVSDVDWGHITLAALASHLGGISRDFNFGDLSAVPGLNESLPIFGQLPASDVPICGASGSQALCTRSQFFDGFPSKHPTFTPFTTPGYSNTAFRLLGYVIENVTSVPYNTYVEEKILRPLNLGDGGIRTSKPDDSVGAVVNGDSFWDIDIMDDNAAGGIYGSSRGLAAFGRSVLNSTLLPKPVTNKWLKPTTFTSALHASVGAPWEIVQTEMGERVVEYYTKSGSLGLYVALLILIPEYGIAASFHATGPGVSNSVLYALADQVTGELVPALDHLAKQQAAQNYAGTYVDTRTNASLTVGVNTMDLLNSGLVIQQWTAAGQDVLRGLGNLLLGSEDPADLHLYYTGLRSGKGGNNETVSFRATFLPLNKPTVLESASNINGWSDLACITWTAVDGTLYGGIGLDDINFLIDENGDATGITLRGLRMSFCKLGTETCSQGS